MTIVLLDTNVLLFGIFWRGAPQTVVCLAQQRHIQNITSLELLNEFGRVLTRPNKPFRLSTGELNRISSEIQSYSMMVWPKQTVTICRDVADNVVLACALEAQAEYIITGDPDLLVLKTFESIPIVTVRDFLDIFQPN